MASWRVFVAAVALSASPQPALALSALSEALLASSLALALLVVALLLALDRLRRRAAAAEATRDARLAEAVSSLPDGVVLWDPEDRLVLWNARTEALFPEHAPHFRVGASFAEIIEPVLQRLPPEERAAARARDVANFRSIGEPFDRPMPDGRWLRVALKRLPDGHVVGAATDITDQRRLIEDLAAARDAADRAMRDRSRLLSHVSHELRTPLAGLLHVAGQLRRDPALSGEAQAQVDRVEAAARHILALSNQVLDLAALEAGRLSLAEESVPAEEPFRDAARIILPVAEARGVALDTRLDGLPPRLHADATRLRQVLLNLLSNAVKHAPPGSPVRLEVRAAEGVLAAEVTDEGPGVPEAARAAIFADFGRMPGDVTEGTGLGLAISARLVALMGGTLECRDGPGGRGACFRLALPLRLPEQAPPPPPPPPGPAGRLRLLAVDDSPANLAVLRALLATTGFALATETSGAAALAAVEAAAAAGAPFDAILMDVMMPGMDGLEVTRRLRALPGEVARTPVLAVTATAFPEDIDAVLRAGMDGHVAKPVERKALLAALGAALARAAPEPDTSPLRPALLAELRARAAALESGAEDRAPVLHAIAGTAGHLGLGEVEALARRAMRAERDAAPEAASLVEELRGALRGV